MTRVFVAVSGQNDNLGDSVLRRPLLRAARDTGSDGLHVLIGDNDDDYLSAVDLRGDETLYRRNSNWRAAMARRALRERTIFMQAAGELRPSARNPLAGLPTLAGAAVARLGGGAAIQLGAGLRDAAAPMPLFERLARRSFGLLAWRDAGSRAAFRSGEVMPDWAFGEGPDPRSEGLGEPASRRRILAISMRGDRPPLAPEQLRFVRGLAAAFDLEPRIFTQVRRDAERARELAAVLTPDRTPLLFAEHSHAEWERTVRALYRDSAAVISDRAHALILGATEGAVPLALSDGATDKLSRILAPADFAVTPIDGAAAQLDAFVGDPDGLPRRISAARDGIDAMRMRLVALVSG